MKRNDPPDPSTPVSSTGSPAANTKIVKSGPWVTSQPSRSQSEEDVSLGIVRFAKNLRANGYGMTPESIESIVRIIEKTLVDLNEPIDYNQTP